MSDDPFLDDLMSLEASTGLPGSCLVCEALEDMDESRRSALQSAIASKIGGARLAKIMTRHGYPTSESTIRRHRQKGH